MSWIVLFAIVAIGAVVAVLKTEPLSRAQRPETVPAGGGEATTPLPETVSGDEPARSRTPNTSLTLRTVFEGTTSPVPLAEWVIPEEDRELSGTTDCDGVSVLSVEQARAAGWAGIQLCRRSQRFEESVVEPAQVAATRVLVVELTPKRGMVRLTGTVHGWNGEPLPDAMVVVTADHRRYRTTTRGDGNFDVVVDQPRESEVAVTVGATGHLIEQRRIDVRRHHPPMDIRLRKDDSHARVRVQLRCHDGTLATGAWVRLSPPRKKPGSYKSNDPELDLEKTRRFFLEWRMVSHGLPVDGEDWFKLAGSQLECPACLRGPFRLRAIRGGEVLDVQFDVRETIEERTFTLDLGRTLRARIVPSDGAGTDDLSLRVDCGAGVDWRVTSPVRLESGDLAWRGLPRTSFKVRIKSPGYLTVRREVSADPEGRPIDLGDVSLLVFREVQGTLWLDDESLAPYTRLGIRTDKDGWRYVKVVEGEFEVILADPTPLEFKISRRGQRPLSARLLAGDDPLHWDVLVEPE
jgi:hypothetical protein